MREALADLLFDDHDRVAAEATRPSIVAKAPRSEAAKDKERTRRTTDNHPVQSFQSLLRDLATLCKNRLRWESHANAEFERVTEPTALQRRAFELLGLPLAS